MQTLPVDRPLLVILIETRFAGPDLIAQQLLQSGYSAEVIQVNNEAGLDLALSRSPDLILADLEADGLNARRALEILRTDQLDLPLIILCTPEQEQAALQCLARGAADYLRGDNLLRLGHCVDQLLKIKQVDQAAQTIAQSEEKYRTLLQASLDAIVMADENGRVIEWNHAAERIYGLSQQQASGQFLWDIQYQLGLESKRTPEIHEDQKAKVLKMLQTGIGPWKERPFKTLFQRQDGSFGMMSSIVQSIKTEKGYMLCGISRDVIEQERAELDLRETHELLQAIIQAAPLAISIIDPQKKIKLWSPAAERLFGWKAQEVLGKELPIIPAEQSDEIQGMIREELSGSGRTGLEGKRIRKDGSSVAVRLSTAAMRDARGNITGSMAMYEDITLRKQVEEALAKSEMKYRGLFSQMTSGCALHEMIYASDGKPIDYITLDANPAYLLFLDTTLDAVIDTKASQILPANELKKWVGIFTPAAAEGREVHYEMFSPLNGRYFEGAAFNTEPGKFAVTFTDATAYRRAENALRESEARFRTLIEKAPSAVLIARQGMPVYGNPLALKMMGYTSEEEFLKTPILENYAPSQQAIGRERSRLRELGLPVQSEYDSIAIRRDGTQFPVHIAFTHVQLSDGPADMAFISDITIQRGAEEEVFRQAAHANALVVLTSRLSTILDLDMVLSVVCEELLTALGLAACSIYLFDETRHILIPTCNFGIPAQLWPQMVAIPIPADRPTLLSDLVYPAAERKRFGLSGLTFSPMVYQNQLVGAVAIPAPNSSRNYTRDETLLVQAFARQGAITIVNLRLFDQARNRARELEDLAEVSSSLRQARSLSEIVPLLIAQTVHVLHADNGTLVFSLNEGFTPKGPFDQSYTSPEWQGLLSRIDRQQLSQDSQAYFSSNTAEGEVGNLTAIHGNTTPIVSYALAKVKSIESLIGFLCVGYFQPHTFPAEEKRLLVAIAEMAGNAIHRTSMMDTLEQRVQVRTRELEALYDIARLTSGSIDLVSILDRCLDRVLEIYQVQSGLIQLLRDDHAGLDLVAHRGLSVEAVQCLRNISLEGSLAAPVIRENQSFLSLDVAQDPALALTSCDCIPTVYLGAPIRAKGEVLGVVSIYGDTQHRFNVEEIALLETIANHIGVAVESARLRQQSEQAAILEERQRLARDLHDSVTQSLFSLNLLAEGYRQHIAQASLQEIDDAFTELGGAAHQALKDMRLLLYELRPSSIQQDGLVTAIQRRLDAVESRSEVKSRFKVLGNPRMLSKPEEVELYHIVQEALNNSLKHASASQIEIRLSVQPKRVQMEIHDNGIGFAIKGLQTEGMGLANMAERARRLGGKLEIQSQPARGTRVKYVKEVQP